MMRSPMPAEHGDEAPSDEAPKQKPKNPAHPPPEEELGGGDICSPEETPAAEDEAPLP